ncbi:unnamed protein product [Strongylus vulgaris]|uniref:Receptor L-domain domain-containing protein n=1 Tax=Strongylus vulgaris TaxID=40348 RepID=A0A3P7ITF4_STRVU|nr:unnamed protein product [Strongylus vulgaris]
MFPACSDTRTQTATCKLVEGPLVLGDPINDDMRNLEEVYGRVIVRKTTLEKLPAMPKLKKIEWKEESSKPAIEITDNANLKSIAELIKVENVVLGPDNKAAQIERNPLLCIEQENANLPFVKKYASHVKLCGK